MVLYLIKEAMFFSMFFYWFKQEMRALSDTDHILFSCTCETAKKIYLFLSSTQVHT